MNNILDTTHEIVGKIIQNMDIPAEVRVAQKEDVVDVSISTDTPALIIGYHGKTLDALHTVVGAILYRKFSKSKNKRKNISVNIDVDNWRTRREEKLVDLARTIAGRVINAKQEESLYNLTPRERRVIHVALGEEHGVTTESVGEGKERHLVIKPAGEKQQATSGK